MSDLILRHKQLMWILRNAEDESQKVEATKQLMELYVLVFSSSSNKGEVK